jgi:hypothetical protein
MAELKGSAGRATSASGSARCTGRERALLFADAQVSRTIAASKRNNHHAHSPNVLSFYVGIARTLAQSARVPFWQRRLQIAKTKPTRASLSHAAPFRQSGR